MSNNLKEDIKNKLYHLKVNMTDEQISELVSYFRRHIDDVGASSSKKIKALEKINSDLLHEKNKYKELLNERFLDRNHQTIAYQVGRLIIDFGKNPIKNFITPKKVLGIYAQYLNRKSRREVLSSFQVKLIKRYLPSDIQSNTLTAESTSEIVQGEKLKTNLRTNLSHKTAKEIVVAVILDEFSYNSFKDEFTPVVLTPQNWKDQFVKYNPDLFFCESAWSGVDSKTRPWKGKIYASKNFEKENRTELLEIIRYCNQNGIPTVFWNKEDPTHYLDRVHDFVKTAQLFDFVFTTAEECVEKYKCDYHLKNVFTLPFATNPRIFNPIETSQSRSNRVVFAGSWYSNHKERTLVMTDIFDRLIANGYELDFYNRYYQDNDPNHIIPLKYQQFERPSISNMDTARAYKSTKYGLNINTVSNSKTMFARRVFELMSSNTLVLSNYSVGMDEFFGSNVIFLDKDPSRLEKLTSVEIERIREEALNNVLVNHTYKERFAHILHSVGINYNREIEKLTFVLKVDSMDHAKLEISNFYKKFDFENKKLLLIVSQDIDDIDVSAFYMELNNNNINVVAESYISKYSNSNSSFIETPYFVITKSLADISSKIVEKALIHSVYTLNSYVSLDRYENEKYVYKRDFIMNNIFTSKDNFMEAFKNFNKPFYSNVYCLEGGNNEY